MWEPVADSPVAVCSARRSSAQRESEQPANNARDDEKRAYWFVGQRFECHHLCRRVEIGERHATAVGDGTSEPSRHIGVSEGASAV